MIAGVSVTTTPRQVIVGSLPIGFSARKVGLLCSRFSKSIGTIRYGAPTSSSIQCAICARERGLK